MYRMRYISPYFEWDPLLASGATEPYLRGVLARLRNE